MGTKREGSPLTSETLDNFEALGDSVTPTTTPDGKPIPYKRVRIHSRYDMSAAYNLACVYIEHPDVADQLEELVLYNDSWTNS
jgi:hypothetical protein